MRALSLYFDFVSPYSYLAFQRLGELPAEVALELKPVLFAGLLHHEIRRAEALPVGAARKA